MNDTPDIRDQPLPSVDTLIASGQAIILYDCVCILCSRWSRFVIKRDHQARFRFLAVQSDMGRAMAQSHGIDRDNPETFALAMEGKVFFKSDAILAILAHMPAWRWTSVFRIVPRRLRDWLYDRIARNRYSVFGKSQTCIMPVGQMRDRFVDLDSAVKRLQD